MGGALVLGQPLLPHQLLTFTDTLDSESNKQSDFFKSLDTRLFDQKMRIKLIPMQLPVVQGAMASAFSWRIDPFTGAFALHTGLDFQADPATPVAAAADGVVVSQELHQTYGNMIEIDHCNDPTTGYVYASEIRVELGDLIKHGQKITEVGSAGRSTGPHLNVQVWVQGIEWDI